MIEANLDSLDVKLDGEAPVYFLDGKVFTGRVNEIRSGEIASTFTVLDGYKDGQEIIYSDTGSVEGKLNFSNGLLNGRVEHYYPNGNLEDEAEFELGVCVASVSYDEAGEETERFVLDKSSPEYQRLLLQRKYVRST